MFSVPRNWLIGFAYLVFLFYMVIVWQQLLIAALVTLFGYLLWRVWRMFEMHTQPLESEPNVGEQTSGQREAYDDPIESLKQQYTTGELSEAEFEERLDELLTEDRESQLGDDSDSRPDTSTSDSKTTSEQKEAE